MQKNKHFANLYFARMYKTKWHHNQKKGEYVQTAQITQTHHIRPAERKMVSMHTSVQVLLKTATVRALVTGRWSEFNTNLTL